MLDPSKDDSNGRADRLPRWRAGGAFAPADGQDQLHVALLGHADDVLHRAEPQFRARETWLLAFSIQTLAAQLSLHASSIQL